MILGATDHLELSEVRYSDDLREGHFNAFTRQILRRHGSEIKTSIIKDCLFAYLLSS
jgi:hypothetical protein